jgi:hypothetical protein
MTQEEAAELLEIFRRDNSEVPPVEARMRSSAFTTELPAL